MLLADEYPPARGGIAEFNRGLVGGLVGLVKDVVVFAPNVALLDGEETHTGARVVRIGTRGARAAPAGPAERAVEAWRCRKEIGGELRRMEASGQNLRAIVSPLSPWGTVCPKRGLPYVVYIHGGDAFARRAYWTTTRYRRLLLRYLVKHAHKAFCNSRYIADMVVRATGADRVAVATVAVGEELLGLSKTEGSDEPTEGGRTRFLTLCRLERIKAVDVILRAVGVLVRSGAAVSLTVAGDGAERQELEALMRRERLERHVRFVGSVASAAEKATLFRSHDVLVQSGRPEDGGGREEAFGIVFLEAGAFGLPTIGPKLGGVSEAIIDGVTGILVPPEDVGALSAAMVQLGERRVLRRDLGMKGRERVYRTFSYKQTAETLLMALP